MAGLQRDRKRLDNSRSREVGETGEKKRRKKQDGVRKMSGSKRREGRKQISHTACLMDLPRFIRSPGDAGSAPKGRN